MTEVTTLLKELEALDVRLNVQGDRLNADAPKGVITPDLAARIREHKAALLQALTAPPSATEPYSVTNRDATVPRNPDAPQVPADSQGPSPDPFTIGQQPGHCGSCRHWTRDGTDYLGLCALGWAAHGLPHQPGVVLITVHAKCMARDGTAWKARKATT